LIPKRATRQAAPASHPVPYHANLDTPLLSFGKGDMWRIRDAVEATAIWGSPGSGKSSGSARALAHAFLKAGMGGLVLCAKPGEADTWRGYAQACGRADDLIIVDGSGAERFNILSYAVATLAGPGYENNLVALMERAAEAARVADSKGAQGGAGDGGRYYYDTASRWLKSAFPLLLAAYGDVSMKSLYDMIRDTPTSSQAVLDERDRVMKIEQAKIQRVMESTLDTPGKQRALEELRRQQFDEVGIFSLKTVCLAAAAIEAKAAALGVDPASLPESVDLALHAEVWTDEIPASDPREGGSVGAIIKNLTGDFATGKLRQLFCEGTTWVPEMAREGKIIVLDLPVLRHGPTAIVAQSMVKYLFGQALQRHVATDTTRPVFLFADEAQFFLNSGDDDLLSTARAARLCVVYATQDLPTYYARLGRDAEHRADAILSKFGTRIFHANTSRETNEAAAEIIGREHQEEIVLTTSDANERRGGGHRHDEAGSYDGGSGRSQSESRARQYRYEYAIPPDAFAWRLRTGGPKNKFKVDAIVIRNGATWKATGKHWIQAEFSQQ